MAANAGNGNQSLLNQAKGIANAATAGPISELAKQIASNNAANAAGQQTDFGYYMQLAQAAKDAVANQQQIGSGLNSTLQGIGDQTQSQIGQFGQQAQGGALGRMNALGLAGDSPQQLAGETARQQGVAAQQAQTYRMLGATQGANYAQNAANTQGTVGLAGTQAIGNLASAGQVANAKLNATIAADEDKRGALTETALGQLQKNAQSYQVALAGLNIKQQGANTTSQNDRANQRLKASALKVSASNNAARIAQQNLDNLRTTNTSQANNAANNSTRVLLQQMKTQAAKNKVATGAQANAVFAHIDYVTGEIQNLVNHGLSPQAAYHLVQNGGRVQTGTSSTGAATYRTYYPNRLGTQVLNAAYNVRSGGGGLTAGDLAWLASLGIRNPTRYPRAGANNAATAVGNTAGNANLNLG